MCRKENVSCVSLLLVLHGDIFFKISCCIGLSQSVPQVEPFVLGVLQTDINMGDGKNSHLV